MVTPLSTDMARCGARRFDAFLICLVGRPGLSLA
jgi:hypothetical protein